MTAKHRALEPIYEEVNNEYALVPVDNSALKKQRVERLKQRARLVSGRERSAQGLPVQEEPAGTFVTGGGLPGTKRSKRNHRIPDDFSDDDSDLGKKLLKDVDRFEKEFKEMLEYLNDVDHMISKDGFGTINEMIDLSNKRVDNHITHYQKL